MKFKAVVPRAQAEAFTTAVLRYLDLRSFSPLDETVVIDSEPHGDHQQMSVRFGTEEAVKEFSDFWLAYSQPPPPYVFR